MSHDVRRLLISVHDVELDIEVPAGSALRLRFPEGESDSSLAAASDLRQFAARFGQSLTYPQKFAAVAYYLRDHMSATTVTVRELADACAEAGWGLTRNARREAENARRRGLLTPYGNGRYQLSAQGERRVLEALGGAGGAE